MNEGKIPTTPTSSSVIAGIQVQEMLKLLHSDRDLPTLAGKGYVFNGLTHDSYVVEYQEKPDCMSHDIYEEIEEKPWSVDKLKLKEALAAIRSDLGDKATVYLDRDIATYSYCECGESKSVFMPVHKLKGELLTCPKCGKQMSFDSKHSFDGSEDYLDKTFAEIGIPALHIISGRAGMNVKHYEFTDDEDMVFQGL